MEFETKQTPGSRDYVADFISSLDDETADKILDKLSGWLPLDLLELARAEHIKKVEGDLWEVRVSIKKVQYRFLGYIVGRTFFMLHYIIKKYQKLKRKDIDEAIKRIKLVKNNENK